MSTEATAIPKFTVVPRHVAVIMDGNGRWARHRGKPRIEGHRAGIEAVRETVQACSEVGVEFLTLYAFSVENWKRPKEEVSTLMAILHQFLLEQRSKLMEEQVRLFVIGRLEDLPEPVRGLLLETMELTRDHRRMTLTLALSYGGRAELVHAVQAISRKVAIGELAPDQITEETVSAHLYQPELPDPDLLIRTSGEMRLSNFLLWQISYTELWVTDVFWPDFRKEHFWQALTSYGGRNRRFGDVTETPPG